MIQLKNITVMDKNHLDLSSFNLSIEKGQQIFIVGNLQQIKVLFDLLRGKFPEYTGHYLYDDKDTKSFSNSQWARIRKKKMIVPLDKNFLMDHFTVEKNIQMQLKYGGVYPTKWKKLSYSVLEDMGLDPLASSTIDELSRWQQFQVRIAKAIVIQPDILLLSDPFKYLGTERDEEFKGLLKDLKKKGIAVMIGAKCEEEVQRLSTDSDISIDQIEYLK